MNEQPRNQIIIQSLTDLLSGIGDIYAQTGDYREALTYFQSGLAYAQQLCKADPREKAFLDSLAMFYFQIGETYMHLNDAVSAKMYLLRANEILTEIDRNFPNNIDIAKNLNSINVLLAQLA
jgi:tetratricopeptide (TPR) repeat protein